MGLVTLVGNDHLIFVVVVSYEKGLIAKTMLLGLPLQSRKHASKVRLYYMLHPIDGGCPAKKLRSENVSIAKAHETSEWASKDYDTQSA